MAEEYKNASEEFKTVPEHETPKVTTTEESSAATGEVKDRGLFDFLGKKEEVKPQETTTPLASEVEHKAQITEEPAFVAKHEEEKEHKPTLLEQLHQKHEEEEENKPSLLHKLHRSNSSSSSSSEEEGEDGEKRKKEKKKIVEGDEKKGVMEKIKEKLPGHSEKPDDSQVVNTEAAVPVTEEKVEHPDEKKGILEKIKEKLPGYHAKSTEEEEKKEKESDA
ncbi:Dehydrin COR47 [Hirschfeldia incana]|nr:Dehydrin COR47 [Hirschfeldia incana]